MYLVKDGGIFTAVDPKTGNIHKQGAPRERSTPTTRLRWRARTRVRDQPERKMTVIKAGAEWEIASLNDFEDEVYATPAIAGMRSTCGRGRRCIVPAGVGTDLPVCPTLPTASRKRPATRRASKS
jgi:hypothetical protein